MPVNPAIRTLAQDGRLSLRDAQDIKARVETGEVSRQEAENVLQRYGEATDQDAAALLADSFSGGNARARLSGLPPGFAAQTLQRGQRGEQVSMLQRGLMAVGLDKQDPGMALASGADGIFGAETKRSIEAFQRANGIPPTGVADPTTLRALDQAVRDAHSRSSQTARPTTPSAPTTPPPSTTPAVRPTTGLRRPEAQTTPATPATPAVAQTTPAAPIAPTVGATLPAGVQPGTTEALISASTTLATGPRAAHYGNTNPWRNIDPNHNAPVDVRMGGLTNRWKCNLFGGNALAAAGFEPPYYGNRGKGEYPVAEDWHKWSTPSQAYRDRAAAEGRTVVDYAARTRNQSRFDLEGELRPLDIADPAERQRAVESLLAQVQPGDVVTVDHPGASGSDGGHVRVCVGRDESGAPLFAQARMNSAEVIAEPVTSSSRFLNEEAIYILRPNTPRQGS